MPPRKSLANLAKPTILPAAPVVTDQDRIGPPSANTPRLTIRLDAATKRQFDIALAENGLTAQNVVADFIADWLARHGRPVVK